MKVTLTRIAWVIAIFELYKNFDWILFTTVILLTPWIEIITTITADIIAAKENKRQKE